VSPRRGIVLEARSLYMSPMTIWILFALMTGAAVMAVLWPLSRRPGAASADDADTVFYRDQIAEIERDLGRGLLSPTEAEAARAEAGRRLLRAGGAGDGHAAAESEPALRRRRAVSTLALSTIPLVALAVYGAYGSPALPSQPLASRQGADPAHMDMVQAVSRLEAHLAQNPQDGRGWEVIAPVYLRTGRFDDAARALKAAVASLGESPERLAALGEALAGAEGGVISAEARSAFDRALRLDPAFPKARFYLARAAEQDGDVTTAKARYSELLASAGPDAPWTPIVRDRLAALGAAADIAALPAADRQAAIRGMVEGLSERLSSQGGSVDEWYRLIRSRMALGERDRAQAALAAARAAHASDRAALARLAQAAGEFGLEARP